jgi:hypothetical protein
VLGHQTAKALNRKVREAELQRTIKNTGLVCLRNVGESRLNDRLSLVQTGWKKQLLVLGFVAWHYSTF